MGNFIATNPAQNATLAQAQELVKKRRALGLSAIAIFAIGNNGDVVMEENFANTEIAGYPDAPMNLNIQTHKAPDEQVENLRYAFPGQFLNVGLNAVTLKKAASLSAAIHQMFAVDNPGMKDSEITTRIMNLPNVKASFEAAVRAAWDAI